ncbi:Unsaturated chondroitin disaccharide hydrolase [Mariniflexile rhizosphaerae]|uniref:glycoside hydrolase family 88 protein n=1 Tax=unclassified Mariniflexile TaxID=2643887 RepID=UPI000CBE1D4F|nr:glycoside hydrolase family 88 protein [Mariniflexile sp. TRM1-10]AXP82069.1 Unsaturated chondroitin disaccharide hydrolase [Mariniflexile sp. TRM1-10]PLB20290.1 MAG: Glucuronyl hydrolase [Flavobacteriaceae bacterium FS1-H7996/R]
MQKLIIIFLSIFIFIACKQEGKQKKDPLLVDIDSTLQRAVKQYEFLNNQLSEGVYPKTYHAETDSLETSNSGWWCSGFYPGMLLYLYKAADAPQLKKIAEEVLQDLKKEQFNTSTHDLGFMMYCSFGKAQQLFPKQAYEEVLMNSAKSLATRYNDTVKGIRSWDNAPWNKGEGDDVVVIIDNMVNLELLFWATQHSGDSTYYNIAVNHADKTMKHHFRDDYSSYHEVIYDGNTGDVKAKITNQGAANESSWARGQAWGLYGYIVTYRETKALKYLEQANHIAHYLLDHPNLPEDHIPYWDFNAPDIPNALRDSSAAAIIASALLELSTYVEEEKQAKYNDAAKTILKTLLTPEYIAEKGTNGGFLLKHGVGNMPNGTEIDTPLTYGDYYLTEAMVRYEKMNN